MNKATRILLSNKNRKLINSLYELPYLQLLQALHSKQLKRLNQLGLLDIKTEIFRLGMFHDSPELYKLSNLNLTTEVAHSPLWLQKIGYASIFESSKIPLIYENKLIEYYTQLNNILQRSNPGEETLPFYQDLYNNPTSILINHFPTKLDVFHRRRIKQIYMKTVHIWGSTPSIEITKKCHCLFPPQIFNLGDHSLMRPTLQQTNILDRLPIGQKKLIANKIEGIIQRCSEIEDTMVWLARYNLGNIPKSSEKINEGLSQLKMLVSEIECHRKQIGADHYGKGLLIIANSVYIIARKLLNLPNNSSKFLTSMVKQLILSIHQILPGQTIDTVKLFVDSISGNHTKTQNQLKSKHEKLFQFYNLESLFLHNNNQTVFETQIYIKLIRFHILLAVFSDAQDTIQYRRAQQFFTFSSVYQFLKKSRYNGDLVAEIIYAQLLSNQMYELNTLIDSESQLWSLLTGTAKEYNRMIRTLQSSQIPSKAMAISRIQNFELLMLYSNSCKPNYQRNTTQKNPQQKIMTSLLNDNEFIGSYLSELPKIINKYINEKDPRIQAELNQHYPLFCDAMLTNREKRQNKISVWIEANNSSKNRMVAFNQELNAKSKVKAQPFRINLSNFDSCLRDIDAMVKEMTEE